ncbi:MAG TPA: cytochrome c [Vicinamibacterales bacterium]|nr:cytochrome c [Vicinamibacterales bacterium]
MTHPKRIMCDSAASAGVSMIALSITLVSAQTAASIWNGAYTAEQAERGRVVVQNHCGECHGHDLGGGEAPALSGSTFMVKWEAHTVERLFHKIRDTMPSRFDTGVTQQQKLDAVAFILQQNGFPAGHRELVDAPGALAALSIVPRSGPSPPRSGALIQTVGCLQEGSGNRLFIAGALDPQVTTLDPIAEGTKQVLSRTPPGSHTIELLDAFPPPSTLIKTRVLVKGLFINTTATTRINVIALEPLGSACDERP